MGVFSEIKKWLTGGSTKSKKKKDELKEANRTSYYGGGVTAGNTKTEVKKSIEKAEKKKKTEQEVDRAFKSNTIKKAEAKDKKTSKKATPPKSVFNTDNAFKATPPDPKKKAAEESRARMAKTATAIKSKVNADHRAYSADKKERQEYRQEKHEAFHAATNHRYDITEKGISDAERRRRAQNIRTATLGEMMGGRDDEALDVMKAKMKYDKTGESLRRGLVGTATAGTLNLAEKRLNQGGRKEAEEYYQANKSRVAETVGSLVGGLLLYGGTANAFENLGTKAVGRAAETQLGKKLGMEALGRTMAGTGIKAGIARSLVGDTIQDSTIGLLDTTMDVAQRDDLKTPSDYAKAILKGQAINYGMGFAGNAVAHGIPVARQAWGNFADESRKLRIVPEGVAETLGRNVDGAGNVKVSLNRKRKTDLVLPNERPKTAINEDEIDDALIEAATTTEDFMEFFGLDRATAELLARDKARSAGREAVEREATFNPFDFDVASEVSGERIPKGNIKSLAETLRTNKELPRSKNREWRATPRSAKRVDTSIEGMTKQLDELKGKSWQTDRERRAIETKINDVEDRLNRAKWRREGGADMEAMQKAYKGEYAGFDMGKYTNSYQSDVLEGKIKGKTATIVEMSPDEYIERTYRQIFKKPTEKAEAFSRIPDAKADVEKYAEAMRNGEQFPLPYLDYSAAQQEGRHRALAAKEAGIDKIPVVIIDDEANPKAIIDEVAKASAEEMPKPEYEEMKTFAQQRADEVMGAEYKQQKPQSKEIPENVQKTADKRSNAIREELSKEDVDPNLKADNPEENIRSALAEDKTKARAKTEKISKGQAAVRDAYEQQTGEKWKVGDNGVETDADKRSTFGQLVEASKEYHQSQGRHTERKLSKYARTQVRVVSKERADYIIENIIKNSQDAEYGVLHHEEVYREVAKSLEEDWDTNINKLADIADGGDWGGKETPKLLATAQFLGELVDDVPRTPETDALAKIAYLAGQNLTTSSAQTMNFRRHFAHLSPASKLDVILSDLAKTLDSAQGFNKKHSKGLKGLNHWERLDYIKGQLLEDKKLVDSIEKMVYAKTPEELDLLRRRNEGLLSQIEGLEKQKAELTEKLKAAEAKATPPLSVDEMAQIKELDVEIEGLNTQKQILDSQIEKAEKANADPDELTKAQAKVIREFNRHNPKTGYDVVQELRYIAMLLNPKTHIRNVGGSGFFKPVRDVSNTIRSAIEEGVAKSVDMELDVKHGGFSPTAFFDSLFSNTEAGKKASEAINKPEIASALAGKSKMAESTTTMRGRSKHLIGKGIDAVSDFSTFLLTKEDELFKRQAFKENYIKSYNKYLKSETPITPKIEAAIEAEALQEAKIATFNEYNELAKYLSKMNRTAYNANASGAVRWLARTGNALMPFAKAPANLTKQSINYSPLGIAKGMYGIKQAAKKNDAKALNKAIDELSSGLTGTGIFALGALLGSTTDMFTTNVGKDDPAGKHKKNIGYQNYSINFVDPETGKGTSFTLDWLVPISAVFFSGVELANQTKANGFNLLDLVHASGGWAQVTSRLAEPVLDTSMMSGLNSMIEGIRGNYNGDDKLGVAHIFFRETTQSYLNSLVPTMLGQASRTMYQSDKQILGDNDWKYWANATRSKAGLANLDIESLGGALGADTNVYGEVKNDKGKSLKQALKDKDEKALKEYRLSALKNFLSPANIQRIDISEVDKAKLDEYEERVKNGENPEDLAYLFPKKAGEWQRNFYYGSEAAGTKTDVKMTNKEISIYNQAKKTGGAEGMRAALDTVIFNRWVGRGDDKHQVEGECYSQEEKDKLIKQFEGKSIREVEEWLYNNKLFKKATKAEQKQVIDDLWSLANASTSVGSKREGERAVIKARGGDLVDYDYKNEVPERVQKNIAGALASGIVDQEKALDFARNAVKKYYKTDPDGVKGGTVSSYYNKKEMMEYLAKSGYSYEEMEALYNAFKDADAKPFSGIDLSSGGGRGWGSGWHSWGSYQKKPSTKISSSFNEKGSANVSGKSKVKPPSSNVSVKSAKSSSSSGGSSGTSSGATRSASARRSGLSSGTTVKASKSRSSSANVRTSSGGSSRKIASTARANTKLNVTPLNIKTVKPSTKSSRSKTSLASALEDIQKTQKKVAPPKARSKK